jgi:hypothetical protein
MEGHVTSYSSQRVDGQFSNPEVRDGSTSHHDVHDDTLVLEFLRTSMVPGMVSAKEKDRVLQRAKRYRLEGTHIFHVWEDGRVQIVPHPAQKGSIMQHAHEELGHFGVKRTYSLLLGQYWWRGMHTDVQQLMSCCMVCDRVRASFDALTPQLHPLPIMEFGLCGTINIDSITQQICVSDGLSWCQYSSEGVAYAFLDRVLNHFGAPVEVLIDQGMEFQGEF